MSTCLSKIYTFTKLQLNYFIEMTKIIDINSNKKYLQLLVEVKEELHEICNKFGNEW